MDENERVKAHFINSFHSNADERLAFLPRLFSDRYLEEAMALCLSYIDSFSQWLQWPSDKSGQNFVKAVVSFGGDSSMGLVHPLQAVRAFNQMKSFWKGIATLIECIFTGPNYELLEHSEFLSQLAPRMSKADLSNVEQELWRTTMAAIAYFRLRNPSIHSFGAGPDISFSNTTHQGDSVPVLDFNRLFNIALNLHSELRRRSDTTGQWFGNDEIIDT
ncbi:MAG: hypothetical protein FJ110_04445 [Deltaproteobacteria bacterium]|nr:hypothetical protein [Deltaproteobacteria bacterium]